MRYRWFLFPWLLFVILLFNNIEIYAQNWSFFVVDTAGNRPAIALNSQDTPHIVYFVEIPPNSKETKYATWNDINQVFDIEVVDFSGVDAHVDFLFDNTDLPHFTYHNHITEDLAHTFNDGNGWIVEEVDSPGHDGWSSSIAIDSNNQPHFCFIDPLCCSASEEGLGIEYGWFDGSNWNIEIIGSEADLWIFNGTSLDLDSQDNPHITFYDDITDNLMYAVKMQGVWTFTAVDSSGDVGRYSDLLLDDNDMPHIAYFELLTENSGIVKYTRFDGTTWNFVNIDTVNNISSPNSQPRDMLSMFLDAQGNAHISYCDEKILKYAINSLGSVAIEVVVDFTSDTRTLGQSSSITLDASGKTYLTYYETDGAVIYAVRDSGGGASPLVSGIPDQSVGTGELFTLIMLDNYVIDPDHTDSEITWTFSGYTDLAVGIDINRVATITAPDTSWTGSETITFTATDPDGLSGSDAASFTVSAVSGSAPVVSDIPDQTISGTFVQVTLSDFVADPDHADSLITWTFSGNTDLTVQYKADRQLARISAPDGWTGSELITFTATDPDGLSDSDDASFTVEGGGGEPGPPVVSDIPGQTVAPGEQFSIILLNDFVDDPDHTDSDITWTFSGMTELTVTYDQTQQRARVRTPNQSWSGSETITFTATDPDGNSDSDDAIFTSGTFTQAMADIAALQDNTLYEDVSGLLSNGAGDYFFSGRIASGGMRRGLIAFDIAAAIPAGAFIDSVFLTLNMSRTIVGDESVELYQLLSDWGEGTSDASGQEGGGAAATTDDATWLFTFYDTLFWATPGGEYATTASASQTVGGNGFYTWGSTAGLVGDVQEWLDTPANNFGWIVVGNESSFPSSKRFDSRTNPTAANQPLLTVFYSLLEAAQQSQSQQLSTVVIGQQKLPQQMVLEQNYPNPFNPTTSIRYGLKEASQVTLKIYNTLGQEVVTLVDAFKSAGYKSVFWDGRDTAGQFVSSGIYIYKLKAGSFSIFQKMIFTK